MSGTPSLEQIRQESIQIYRQEFGPEGRLNVLRDVLAEGQTHIDDVENPHELTAAQVNLDTVQNLAMATLEEARDGISDQLYTSIEGGEAYVVSASSEAVFIDSGRVVSPTNGDQVDTLTPTLVGGPYGHLYNIPRQHRVFEIFPISDVTWSDPEYIDLLDADELELTGSLVPFGQYKWRYRDVDASGRTGPWISTDDQGNLATFQVASVTVTPPVISTTENLLAGPLLPTFTTEAFASDGVDDEHIETVWEVVSDGQVIWSTTVSTGDLNSLTIPETVLRWDTSYTIKAYHMGSYGISAAGTLSYLTLRPVISVASFTPTIDKVNGLLTITVDTVSGDPALPFTATHAYWEASTDPLFETVAYSGSQLLEGPLTDLAVSPGTDYWVRVKVDAIYEIDTQTTIQSAWATRRFTGIELILPKLITFDGGPDEMLRNLVYHNGYYYISGNTSAHVFLMKVDLSGNVVWATNVDAIQGAVSNFSAGLHIHHKAGVDRIVIVHTRAEAPSALTYISLYDLDGNYLDSRRNQESSQRIVDSVLVGDNLWMVGGGANADTTALRFSVLNLDTMTVLASKTFGNMSSTGELSELVAIDYDAVSDQLWSITSNRPAIFRFNSTNYSYYSSGPGIYAGATSTTERGRRVCKVPGQDIMFQINNRTLSKISMGSTSVLRTSQLTDTYFTTACYHDDAVYAVAIGYAGSKVGYLSVAKYDMTLTKVWERSLSLGAVDVAVLNKTQIDLSVIDGHLHILGSVITGAQTGGMDGLLWILPISGQYDTLPNHLALSIVETDYLVSGSSTYTRYDSYTFSRNAAVTNSGLTAYSSVRSSFTVDSTVSPY